MPGTIRGSCLSADGRSGSLSTSIVLARCWPAAAVPSGRVALGESCEGEHM